MPIRWKKRFKPELVFERIRPLRTVGADGQVSYAGFEVHGDIQVLTSMLDFPEAAARIDRAGLIWSGLNRAGDVLDKASFLDGINRALDGELAAPLQPYVLLTSLSIGRDAIPARFALPDAVITSLPEKAPSWRKTRADLLKRHPLSIPATPESYAPIRVRVIERRPFAAAQKATASLDLLRGLIAMRVNFSMQWTFGASSNAPINKVRTGAAHTLHLPNGEMAIDALWYEPHFAPVSLFESKDAPALFRALRHDVMSLKRCRFGHQVIASLVRYARAFDEPDPNVAFLKLWSALESLVTPGVADYEALVRRCSFLFQTAEYHQQVLEHLRAYRNASVHAGVESDEARTNCYLLQQYFRAAVRFYVGNRRHFATLEAANHFLDLPAERSQLEARLKLVRQALRFVTPSDAE